MYRSVCYLTALLLIGAVTAEIIQDQPQEIPKLPVYIGLAYNLLRGNPMSNYVDQGFGHPIFKVTYKNKTTTSDNRYLVPDGVAHRVVSSCSFDSAVSSHRGTQSYQQMLRDKVSTTVGIETATFEASFSTSRSYQILEKSTIQQQMSITQATAQCEAYLLSIDLFKSGTLEDAFIAGVNTSYHSNNWENFVNEFGSHFVSEVVMGGRAAQQIVYNFQAVSTLKALDIDISVAAKARFGMFFGDRQTDWHKYQDHINYTQMFTNETSELYIGGHAPRDGNIITWTENVITNPMPIRYKLVEISQLFEKVPILSIKTNLNQVKKSYVAALDAYCRKAGCKKPIPDLPIPDSAKVQVIKAQAVGPQIGNRFEFMLPGPTVNVIKFIVRTGANVDGIQMLMSDGVKNTFSPAFGGMGGGAYQWSVPQGEYISQIEYYYNSNVMRGFTLITNKGTKSPSFGDRADSYNIVTLPDGYRIIGIYGVADSQMRNFGFILGRTVYPVKSGSQASDKDSSEKQPQGNISLELS